MMSSGTRKTNSTRSDQGDQTNFQILSDTEYARQLQAESLRGRELDVMSERRRESGVQTASLGRETTSVVSMVTDQSDRESERRGTGYGFISGLESGRGWSQSLFPGVNSNDQSTGEMLSSLGRGVTDRRRSSPLSHYILNESLRKLSSERSRTRGAEGQKGNPLTQCPFHDHHSAMIGGAGPSIKLDKKHHPWPSMGTLQWTPTGEDSDLLYCDVAALHSEILLVTHHSRKLFSWSCDVDSPMPKPHPLNKELGLLDEAISLLQSSECRATVVTVSGKLATFYDGLLRDCPRSSPPSLIQSLSHPATEFPEFQGETVTHLAVSNFLSLATTQSGRVLWWGLTPQPKKELSSSTTSSSAPSRQQREGRRVGGRGRISEGSLVRLKNGPPCGPNAIVFTVSSTHGPQVGKTVSVMERSSVDPKTSVLVKVFRDSTDCSNPGLSSHDLYDSSDIFSRLEVWKLSDVIFLDDSPSILGRVVAIDKQQVVVDCGFSQSHRDLVEESSAAKSSLKVFRLGELEACLEGPDFHPISTQGTSAGQAPSCEQTTHQPRVVSRHVAGTVQHCPVIILDPSPPKSQPIGFNPSDSLPSSSRLSGFKPLAIQATDLGPNLLVERVSDGAAFLVCSTHLMTGALNVTSFVALGYHDTKVKRCTISEERVDSIEGGLKLNPVLLQTATSMTKPKLNFPGKNAASKELTKTKRRTRKGKSAVTHRTTGQDGTITKGLIADSSLTSHDGLATSKYSSFLTCEFVTLTGGHHDLFCLCDTGGTIWPLLDGLSLKCSASGVRDLVSKQAGVPLQSYRCVKSRQYCVESRGEVAIFVLVPHTKTLLPTLQNGLTKEATSLLSNLSSQIQLSTHRENSSLSVATKSESKRVCQTRTNKEMSMEVPKPVLETSKTGFDTATSTDVSNKMSGKEKSECVKSSKTRKRQHKESKELREKEEERLNCGMEIEGQVEREEVGGDDGGPPSAKRMKKQNEGVELDIAVLMETTVNNCNILHVCCGGEEGTTTTFDPSLDGGTSDGVGYRRLSILDDILSCTPLRPVLARLLCCKNARGHVPFQHALHNQNYSAALKLLQFVVETTDETSGGSHDAQNPFPNLLNEAILAPGQNGMTPLHSLIASFCDVTDVKNMSLFVSRLPQNFTAQQLLRLFQKRYPSAYKAEIMKEEEREGSDLDSSDDETTAEGEREREGGRANSWWSMRNRPRGTQVLAEHPRHNSFFNNSTVTTSALNGIVHFSDLAQLRAALKEMHSYRVVTTASRNTGFGGHMTSVNFMNVHLEEPQSVEEDAMDSSSLFNQIPDLSDYFATRGDNGDKKNERKRARTTDPRLSSPLLAHELFIKLLAFTQACTAVTSGGDTLLATLVHNPRCLSALEDAAKQNIDTPVTTKSAPFPESLRSLSDIILSRDSRHSTSTQHGMGPNAPRGGLLSTSSLLTTPLMSLSGFQGNKSSNLRAQRPTNSSIPRDTSPKTGTASDATQPVAMETSGCGPVGPDSQQNLSTSDTTDNFSNANPSSSSTLSHLTNIQSPSPDAPLINTTNRSQVRTSPPPPPPTNPLLPPGDSESTTAGDITVKDNSSFSNLSRTATLHSSQPPSNNPSNNPSNSSHKHDSGLKLAEYTLENLPENESHESDVPVYVSEVLSSLSPGKGMGDLEGLDLFGALGLPSSSGNTESLPPLPSPGPTQPIVTAATSGRERNLSPISSALFEVRKLQKQLDGDLKRLKQVEQRYQLIASAPPHLREVAKVMTMGKEGNTKNNPPITMATDKQTKTQSLSQSDTNVVMLPPSNSSGSDSKTTPRGIEPGQKNSSKRTIPQSLFQDSPSTGTKLSKNESESCSTALPETCDFLSPLFTNWPCIVTTVLGFYPLGQSSDGMSILQTGDHNIGESGNPPQCWPSQSNTISSVQSLDSFTMHLILNCSDHCIRKFTTTIAEKINSCLSQSTQCPVNLLDINVNDIDMKSIDVSILPILVGKRFLNSVIRVLGMEHSRVKNTFVEMQQLRMRGAEGEGGGGRGGREQGRVGGRRGTERTRPGGAASMRNVVKITKSILTQFSWMAIYSLAESADIAATPVRLGIAKPMGANSVSAEYSTNSHRPSTHSSYRGVNRQPEDQFRSHQRQLHIRSAYHLPTLTSHSAHPHLPAEGIVLRPVVKSDALNSNGTASTDSVCADGEGGALQDSSFEDGEGSDHEEDTDLPSSQTTFSVRIDDDASVPSPRLRVESHWNPMWSSSSSEDEDYQNFAPFIFDEEPELPERGSFPPARQREQPSPDNIYPYAWALDGRRIGETSNTAARSDSPTSFLFGGHHEPALPLFTIPSVRFGAGFLARTFSRFVKDLVDITTAICDAKCSEVKVVLPPRVRAHLLQQSLFKLESTWQWVVTVLDVAEGQLQRGQDFDAQRHVMSLRSDGPHPTSSSSSQAAVHASRSFIGSTPAEYMTYLLRAHSREDSDCLPVIDLYGYEHVVYILDALIYTLTHWPKSATAQSNSTSMTSSHNPPTNQTNPNTLQMEPTPTVPDDMDTSQPPSLNDKRFFLRSESILSTSESEGDPEIQKSNQKFFGPSRALLESPDLVGSTNLFGEGQSASSFSRPLSEAYPLAQQPHLLKPYAKKEHLFNSPSRTQGSGVGGGEGGERGGGEGGGEDGKRRKSATSLPVSYRPEGSSPPIPSPVTLTLTVDQALQRWHSCISVFAHVFLAEGPGSERDNFLNARAGFASRMARFRQQVSQLYEASISNREWSSSVSNSLSLRIRRDYLLQDSLEHLQQLTKFHFTQVRVKFEGEEGTGPGVNRGFFSNLSNELKSADTTKPVLNQVGLLFSEPGKHPEQSGLFAPCPFISRPGTSPSKLSSIRAQRKTYFRAIGRYLGLCFWFRYTIPFMVCRHVAKYLLGRELAWHDLAFYNADLYEGLRSMLLDAQEGKKSKEEFIATYCCYFEAPLSGPMEPVLVDLIPGGSKIPVIPERVQEYVRLYATFMMYGCVSDELQAMKEGLNDIIPPELLAGLTAEDFQLLLSGGSANISLSRLKSVIRFNHTHGNPRTVCDRFEKMFWRVVSHMTNTQRQELLYFATGSGALPTETDTSAQTPALLITINVIGSSNTNSLPVASTCSQRMSIPLYPSYLVLKKKLLQAIQCQAYGLG